MTEIHQPHDRFFSRTFSRMDLAEDILLSNIPAIADLIQPGTLEQTGESFINAKLGKMYSDLLLKAKSKSGNKTVYIYILLEHKSYHEPDVSYDLLGYLYQIWEKIKEKGKPLPFIFPVVIYHGKPKWTSETNFASLVDIPEGLDTFTPHFDFNLFDLAKFNDEEIQGTIRSRVVLLLFKHIFADDFGGRLISICGLLTQLHKKNRFNFRAPTHREMTYGFSFYSAAKR